MDRAYNPQTVEYDDLSFLTSMHYDVLTSKGRGEPMDIRPKDVKERVPSSQEGIFTTNNGAPVISDDRSLKVGWRGPTLLEDHYLREKLMSFDHERIPERVVHARGCGAYGVFKAYGAFRSSKGDRDVEDITCAKFLKGGETDVFVRFSQVIGGLGSSDTVRDVRGFAVKFYTEEGNYDLVGNNIPVFFIQDGMKFPDLAHAIKQEPDSDIPTATAAHDNFWDFISLTPESIHMILWVLSDVGLPRSYRTMEGAAVHSFTMINKEGKLHLVKLHWKPVLGVETLSNEAAKYLMRDPDYLRRDLRVAIEEGKYPVYYLCVQLMPFEDQNNYEFDPLDPTKVWDEERFPFYTVGEMTLSKNVDNHFAEVEQSAFHPGHLVPGIGLSNDPLLQGRLFSYLDTQISRLGVNFGELPVNRAKVCNNQRDGKSRHTIFKGKINYSPSGFAHCRVMGKTVEGRIYEEGEKTREIPDKWMDHFTQARYKYETMTDKQKDHLIKAFYYELGRVESLDIRHRMISLLHKVHEELASRVAAGLIL